MVGDGGNFPDPKKLIDGIRDAQESRGLGDVYKRQRVNHTMARMLAMVVNELQYNWDEQLPHVEFAYNNLAGATTGLALNGVHMGRVPVSYTHLTLPTIYSV